MKKTYWISAFILGFSLVLLFGPSSPVPVKVIAPGDAEERHEEEPNAAQIASPVELHIALSVPQEGLELLERKTKSFEERNPHVSVKFDLIPQRQAYARYLEATSLGTAPDVMLLDTEWVRSFASEGRLRALDDVIAVERQNRWFDILQQTVRWNGYIWAVPAVWDPYAIVYNAAVLQEHAAGAGGPFPSTVMEWLERYGDPALNRSDRRVWSIVADAFAAPGKPAAERAGNGKGEVLHRLSTAWNKGAKGVGESLDIVRRGERIWTVVPLSEALRYSEERGEAVDSLKVTNVPEPAAGVHRSVPPLTGRSFAVSPDSSHMEEAAEWIAFVTDTALPTENMGAGSGFPATTGAYPVSAISQEAAGAATGFPLRSMGPADLGALMRDVGKDMSAAP